MSPSYALLAEDGIVQAVPEHPKKENVFCLSNAYGDVYLFQVSQQHGNENYTQNRYLSGERELRLEWFDIYL